MVEKCELCDTFYLNISIWASIHKAVVIRGLSFKPRQLVCMTLMRIWKPFDKVERCLGMHFYRKTLGNMLAMEF